MRFWGTGSSSAIAANKVTKVKRAKKIGLLACGKKGKKEIVSQRKFLRKDCAEKVGLNSTPNDQDIQDSIKSETESDSAHSCRLKASPAEMITEEITKKVIGKDMANFKIKDIYKHARNGNYLKAKESHWRALDNTSDRTMKSKIHLAMANASLKQRDRTSLTEEKRLEVEASILFNYKMSITQMPDDSSNYEALRYIKSNQGNLSFYFGNIDDASKQYSQVMTKPLDIDENVFAQVIYNYAMIKYKEEKYDEALSCYKDLLLRKESNENLLIHVPLYNIAFYTGRSSFQSGDYDLAISMLSKFLSEYNNSSSDADKYDLSQVHLMLADIYEERGESNENLDIVFRHYVKYLQLKDSGLLLRLQSDRCIECHDVNSEIVHVLARLGEISFTAENFSFAGNCLREAFIMAKSLNEKDYKMLLFLVEKAFISYTLANNKEKSNFMLQEITSIMEEIGDCEFPLPNEDADNSNNTKRDLYWKALRNTSVTEIKSQIYLSMANAAIRRRDSDSISEEEKSQLEVKIIFYYEIAIAVLPPNSPHNNISDIRAQLGNFFFHFGDYDGASQQYSKVIWHKPDITKNVYAQMIYNFATIKCREGEYNRAQSFLKELHLCRESDGELLSHIPDYDIAYNLGRSSFHISNYDLATEMLTGFLREYNDDKSKSDKYDVGQVYLMLGDIYKKKDKCNENLNLAILHYNKYLELKHPKLLASLQSNEYIIETNSESESLEVLSRLGQVSLEANKFTFAGNCFREKYYAMKSFHHGNDHETLFHTIEKAYISYTKAGSDENRFLVLKEITSMVEEIQDFEFPLSDEQLADYHQTLGDLCKRLDKNNSVSEYYIKCLESRKRYLGAKDPKLEKLQCEISSHLYNEGKYDEALKRCRRLQRVSNDMSVRIRALCITGKVYAKRGDKVGCDTAFKKTLKLAKQFGENCLDLSVTYEVFGQAKFELGLFDESVDCFHNAYRIRATKKETETEGFLNLIQGMVDGYKMMRKYKLALVACSKILATQHKMQISQTEIASTMEIMGDLHCLLEDKDGYINGVALYRLASEMLIEHKGPCDEALVQIYTKMAKIFGLGLREYEKSLQLFRKVICLYYKMGCTRIKTEEYDKALNYLNKGLALQIEHNFSAERIDNVQTSFFLSRLGFVHLIHKDDEKALQNFTEALEILERIPDLDERGLALSLELKNLIKNETTATSAMARGSQGAQICLFRGILNI